MSVICCKNPEDVRALENGDLVHTLAVGRTNQEEGVSMIVQASALGELLRTTPNVKTVYFYHFQIVGPFGLFAEALAGCKALTALCHCGQHLFSSEAIRATGKALAQLPKLRVIDATCYDKINVYPESFSPLELVTPVLQNPLHILERVGFGLQRQVVPYEKFWSGDGDLLGACAASSTLQRLLISSFHLQAQSTGALTKLIEKTASITRLVVTLYPDTDLLTIAQALSGNASLQRLTIHRRKHLTNKEATAFRDCLKDHNFTLLELCVEGYPIEWGARREMFEPDLQAKSDEELTEAELQAKAEQCQELEDLNRAIQFFLGLNRKGRARLLGKDSRTINEHYLQAMANEEDLSTFYYYLHQKAPVWSLA